ncbi:Uncharacterised protein [Pseudomonas fluorescens]|uniref:Uncharacterized protein n=1 Tax=Pseudomonas fluorescens TaxID=294 RepID=A0A379ILQ9_PSEFL|nr:hypothetical protein [Pseudomonas fluorescens]AIG03830.1 hypothetical protein HZ99_17225 [Pseudomonas fluorescens]SUD34971.1 Uncharacterised protein [Pseudomonas fluorescens]
MPNASFANNHVSINHNNHLPHTATRLERTAQTIEKALTRLNLTESDRPSAALNRKLHDSTAHLYELGKSTRVSLPLARSLFFEQANPEV